MKSAIVTGANGFIGGALLRELSSHKVSVFAVVKDEIENVESIRDLPGVKIVYCGMDELENLTKKVPDRPEVFYHLAWAGSTGLARADYELQLKNTKWVLDAVNMAKELGCQRFVGAGTLAELDAYEYSLINGSTPNAVSCYGAAKIAAHLMSKAQCNFVGIDHLWACLSNTYGIGNYTSNFVNFASKTMIIGKPANFTNGEQPYDFVYVSDIAQGLYCIGEKGKTNYTYYIGSTQPAKLKEYIKIIRDEIDPEIHLNLGAVPFNGVQHPAETFDCTDLVVDTGYCPKVAFRDGIKITVKWLRQQIESGRL